MSMKPIVLTSLSFFLFVVMGAFLPMPYTVNKIAVPNQKVYGTQLEEFKNCSDSFLFKTYDYKKTDSQTLRLDVFTPGKSLAGNNLHPVIILFHGGGWVRGDRSQMHWQSRYFAEHGLVAVTADYRFIGSINGDKEICIMDAKSAIRWVKSHAAELKIDTSKIIIGGGSAGGHLATMAVLNQSINDPQDDTRISASANALVLFNPAYSLMNDQTLEPFVYIRPHLPAMISYFGSKDKWKEPAISLNKMWKEKGNRAELWIAEDEKHAFFNKSPWNMATCSNALHFLGELGLAPVNNIQTMNTPDATLMLEF